jgi:filamentous hemagglutinin
MVTMTHGSGAAGVGPHMSRCRASLLACTALAGGIAAGLFGSTQNVLAACVVGANTVDCGTTTTNDSTTTNGVSSVTPPDREYLFTAGGAVTSSVATVAAGATVDGKGLAITNTQAGAAGAITVNNLGTVTLTTAPGGAHGGTAAFNLDASGGGGSINYTGNGNVTDGGTGVVALHMVTSGSGTVTVGSVGTPVVPTYSGTSGLVISSANGAQNVFLDGGNVTVTTAGRLEPHRLGFRHDRGNDRQRQHDDDHADHRRGQQRHPGTGNVTVGGTAANTTIGVVSGTTGISATTGGAGTVNVTTVANVTGTAAAGNGISTIAATGATTINTSGGTVQGGNAAISSTTGAGNIGITNSGTLQNSSASPTSLVVSTTSTTGKSALTNNGTMTGLVTLGTGGTGTNTLTNTGTWSTFGTSTLPNAGSAITNTGTVNVAGNSTFTVATLNNSTGVLNLNSGINPAQRTLTTSGIFTGGAGSSLNIGAPGDRQGVGGASPLR